MKILLLGHGRCGSTSLHLGLSDVLGLSPIIEPFNKPLWDDYYQTNPPYIEGDLIPNDVIFKTINGPNFNNDWIIENYAKFDKVIMLIRSNIRETLISNESAKKHGYSNKYKSIGYMTNESISYVSENYKWLFDFYTSTEHIHLIWYEDLYSNYDTASSVLKSSGIPLSDSQMKSLWDGYLNPIHRLRQV